MDAKSGAAALFETFYLKFMRNTFQDEMGEKLFRSYIKGKNPVQYAMDQLWRQKSSWYDRQKTSDQKESFRDILLLSFRQSVSHLKEEMGSDVQDWQWGDIHTLELKHPLASVKILDIIFGLNRGPFALGGSMHTIPQFAYKYNKPFGIVHGPSQRHVYNLEDWDKSYSVIPTGNSGIVGSEHYCDQTDLFVRGNYHPDYFSKKLIMKHARYTLQLKP
jgi:penicillin amidase